MSYPQQSSEMQAHPDYAEMRERLERTASSGQAIALEGLILLAGVYAAISPWVVHFTDEPNITINNLIIGITVGLIALGMTTAPGRMLNLTWVIAPIGVWLVLSPWVVTADHSARAGIVWNNCFLGGVTAVLGLAAMGLTVGMARRGRQ
ncbi:SPW repeat protein [Streptomyces viridochromogenes]|uniref:Putative membrane protein n=1 Tax=Streptomyces viridochromogenes Tue57 TaxID=1160705 RepID=L8P3V3_STRVR|nr:SPW repeat protein [Streptomyces viridochromogenes]ELS50864.1 putative membrane protein [Streptomyces viridochromogenes Tue57]